MKHLTLVALALSFVTVGACKSSPKPEQDASATSKAAPSEETNKPEASADKKSTGTEALPDDAGDPKLDIATFAGGCFWCMQPPFDRTKGVVKTIVGYTGGDQPHPTYEQVSSGTTGHAESIRVYFNPKVVSYDKLLDVYWHHINPTQPNGQFVDHGSQYRSVIFYHDAQQKKLAEQSKKELAQSGRFKRPIVTAIEPAKTFWKAEEYHQEYYRKNPGSYHQYHDHSGRLEFFKRVWGADAE